VAGVEDLAGMVVPSGTSRWDTGTVVALVDDGHAQVDLGDRVVTATVPASLLGTVALEAFVRVSLQENSAVLDSVISGGVAGLVPVGAMVLWMGASPPTGWLLCDGSTYSSATYPRLYEVLGSTTLPDLRGRVPVGKAASGTFATLAGTGGAETHTLVIGEIPSHAHSYGSNASTAADGALHGTAINDGSYTSGYAGGGGAHNNLQPYIVVQFIVKAV